jgi:hypothetical protein
MARYFFDLYDGDIEAKDTEGLEFDDREEMRRAALAELPDIARDALPDGDEREFVVAVRSEGGQVVFRAALSLGAGWVAEED